MIRYNTDCPYCHDIFDQYCNLFKGYKNCDKSDCEVLKMLKENEQLKQELKNTFIYNKKVVTGLVADKDYLKEKNDQLKRKIGVMQSCHFNSCIGCNDKKCEVKE